MEQFSFTRVTKLSQLNFVSKKTFLNIWWIINFDVLTQVCLFNITFDSATATLTLSIATFIMSINGTKLA